MAVDEAPLDWGANKEMSALETLMWRAEADPRLRSTICVVEQLDTTPEWDRFLAAHDWGSRLVPRFRQRVVEPALGVATPRWAVDPDFDLHYHVRRVALPAPGGFDQLMRACEQLAMTPFDRARPPWEAYLFEGLPDGRTAYMLKTHHAVTDGMGGVQLFSNLHSSKRAPSPDKPQPPAPAGERTTALDALGLALAADARRLPGVLRDAGGALRALAHPDRTARDAVRFGASLRRVLGDVEADGSPLLRARSLSWRFGALDVAFADLRAAGKAVGGSLNDAYLAALLGGFRRYHEELGAPIERMPIAIPISLRRSGDDAGGNRFAGARLAAPVGIVDPAERMAALRARVQTLRGEPAIDGLGFVSPLLSRLPGPLIAQLAGGMTKDNDLQASNIPGLRDAAFLAGARVERMYPYGPLPGCATMITLLTHGDTACVGINLDPAAIGEPERFARCLVEGFGEVLELADGGEAIWRG